MRFPWTTEDGEEREALAWPCEHPRAILACLHGMSGAAEQFEPLTGCSKGLTIYSADLRGQGNDRNQSRRGALLYVAAQHRDIRAFLASIRTTHPGLPVFLAGESMGALLAASFAAAHPENGLNGLVLSVPVTAMRRPVPKIANHLVRFLATTFPKLRCRPSLFVNGKTLSPPLTRDTAYQDAMRSKPHYISDYTFRFLAELGELIASSQEYAERLHTPSLTLAAGQDCFVTAEQIRAWHTRIPASDKTLRVYPDAYHLLWQDWDRDQVLRDIGDWIEARLA